MDSASSRVFGLPELASVIASYLNKKALTQVMLTSRQMHAAVEPWFYHDLRTYYQYLMTKDLAVSLCVSPEGLMALSRNIHCVRIWESDLFSLVFISHATTAIQRYNNSNNDSNNTTTTTTNNNNNNNSNNNINIKCDDNELNTAPLPISSFLTWTSGSRIRTRRLLMSPVTTISLLRLIPLAPVMLLSCLTLTLPVLSDDRHHTLPNHVSSPAITVRLCVVLHCLPNLRELILNDLSAKNPRCIQLLASTLLQMNHLRRLELHILLNERYPCAGLLLFFGCPSSIETFKVEFREYETGESEIELPSDWSSFSDIEDALIDALDAGTFESAAVVASAMVAAESLSRGPINGPFVNLRDLQLESCMEKATLEQALSIFKSCPNLETLVLTEFFVPGGLDGADVGRMCPNLHTLRLDGIGQMTDDILWPLGIMTTLPKDRMEILKACVGGPYQWLNAIVASKTIMRHSGSLREIYACSRTASEAMGLILGTCEVLEVLEICCSAVSLEDAVASPWASTKIVRLSISIMISLPSTSSLPDTQYTAFYLHTPPLAPSEDENHLFAQLDVFYRQVGKQERLRYLNLTRARRSENGLVAIENSAKQKSLPGMLRLGGDNSNIGGSMNRPGFLHLLGGLSKLEVIKGLAVCPETEDGRMPADVMEVEWIRVHWPLLQKTGFSASKRPQENFLYL
jgi:hypothetical protein